VLLGFNKLALFSMGEMRFLLGLRRAQRPDAFRYAAAAEREQSRLHAAVYVALLAAAAAAAHLRPSHIAPLWFLALAFWLPQIARNVALDTGGPFQPAFVWFTSASRLALPLYLYACPRSFLRLSPAAARAGLAEPDPPLALALAAWLLGQAALLHLQRRKGAHCFLPPALRPSKYNYAQRIPPALIGATCSVCLTPVTGVGSEEHMLNPCGHLFHKACLMQWLAQAPTCPTCRADLPS
jgi:hypothetical protein